MKKQTTPLLLQLRQGDVLLQQVAKLPPGCTEVPPEGQRIVLAHGEVTGHAHAIYDHLADDPCAALAAEKINKYRRARGAEEITEAAIARAQAKASLWQAPSGDRYLTVSDVVHLRHEEHTVARIDPKNPLPRGAKSLREGDVRQGDVLMYFEGWDVDGNALYRLPAQVEYTPAELRRVAD